jgi:hypothetical protein
MIFQLVSSLLETSHKGTLVLRAEFMPSAFESCLEFSMHCL